jgi:hypothetical protein
VKFPQGEGRVTEKGASSNLVLNCVRSALV